MKNVRMIAVAISVAVLSIAFGCEKEEVVLLPQAGHPHYSDESKIVEEEQQPNSQPESVPCDTLCCSCDTICSCDGFELPEKIE